ncbi:11021_t:CDS:2, partial [Rhizophagus irregularis]
LILSKQLNIEASSNSSIRGMLVTTNKNYSLACLDVSGRFLAIRGRFPDDLNNIIFFMVGPLYGANGVLLNNVNAFFYFLDFWMILGRGFEAILGRSIMVRRFFKWCDNDAIRQN